MNFCLMLLWLVTGLHMSFSRTWLRYMDNLSLMLFWFQLSLVTSSCTSWLLNFSNDLFMLSWFYHLNNFGRCALRNMMDNVSMLDSLRKNLLNNLCWSRLRDMLNNLLVFDSLRKNFFYNFGRGALWLFDNDISDLLFLWQVLFNNFCRSTCWFSAYLGLAVMFLNSLISSINNNSFNSSVTIWTLWYTRVMRNTFSHLCSTSTMDSATLDNPCSTTVFFWYNFFTVLCGRWIGSLTTTDSYNSSLSWHFIFINFEYLKSL